MARSMFCIYAGGLVVDFGVIPLWTIHWWRRALASPLRRLPYLPPGDDAVRIFRDGVRVLFDHDGDLARLRDTLLALPVPAGSPPGLDAFQRNLGDFWYGPADIARHLRRGEVFQAQMLLHRPQKRCLLTMIEWHARCRGGWVQADGLNRTKTLEKWADPRVVEALPALFGGCEADACWRSLLAQMDIFYDLSREVAAHLGYDIPVQDDAIRAWIRTQVPVDEAWA